ncbi:phage portal protein [Paenibacillus sp. J2TS4]|uniref:phage tail assembly chaperone n=1 Tax=Paenibacillus sp. J2TS4 TaxID=2807194 RepID=UPI001B0F058E|nr:phage portal protein [Paenibacillus sp. J2TS4]GIP35507.1 phage portal protein [Paenibacillus sp. J2TS4]
MSDLSMFFAQNALADLTEEVIVSPRFRDANGKAIAWKLQSMTEEENESCRKAATKRVKGKNGVYTPEINSDEYVAKLAVASVVYPNLKDDKLQKSYGVLGAESLLRKMLLPGEYATLVQKVQEINGFDKDLNELVDEVKN